MSEFTVPVVRVRNIQKHPNADTLSITEVEGCPVIFKTGELQEGSLAVYFPVDSVISPGAMGLEFLGERPKDRRIKAKRLRGVFSMGLLMPLDAVLPFPQTNVVVEHEDVARMIGVVKYEEPEEPFHGKIFGGKPNNKYHKDPNIGPVYDLEPYRKYKYVYIPGEDIVVTEKIHGTNFRFGVTPRTGFWAKIKHFITKTVEYDLHIGSHKVWRDDMKNVYGEMVDKFDLAAIAAVYPDYCFYGEIFGDGVQDLTYGAQPGERWLRIFDIYNHAAKRWLDYDELGWVVQGTGLIPVPVLFTGQYNADEVYKYAQGKSTLCPNQIREGCVIRTYRERRNVVHDRTLYKLVGEDYLLRKDGTEKH